MEGLRPGDFVELTERAGLERGALRMLGRDGEVKRMQGQVMEVRGSHVRIRRERAVVMCGQFYPMVEWIGESEIECVVEAGLAVIEESPFKRYWE